MVPLWLLQVADQLSHSYKDPASLLAAGQWMSAPELVHIIDTTWKHAELDLQKGVTMQASRQLHDAALGSVTFWHLPPVRLPCIRGLLLPVTAGLACILTAGCLVVRATGYTSSPCHHCSCTSSCLATRMHASGVRLPCLICQQSWVSCSTPT